MNSFCPGLIQCEMFEQKLVHQNLFQHNLNHHEFILQKEVQEILIEQSSCTRNPNFKNNLRNCNVHVGGSS